MLANEIKSTTDCDYRNERDFVCCSSQDMMFQIAQLCRKKARLDRSKILIRVLQGGDRCKQLKYFDLAKTRIREAHPDLYDLLSFEILINDQIKANRWGPEETVNWLLDSDIHFILTHVHQGLMMLPNREVWNQHNIENHFWRLKCHRGFPNGIHLKCRIFLQDKWGYLVAVKDRVLPTLKVPLAVDLDDPIIIEAITKYVCI